MRRIALVLEYDGTDFVGFAAQKEQRTIHSELTRTVERAFDTKVNIVGASRTDSGVHAKGQTVHFDFELPIESKKVLKSLNKLLPYDLVVKRAFYVPDGWDARFSAHSRLYRYTILNREQRSPFLNRTAMHERHPLDAKKMNIAASALIGLHDFRAFTLEPGDSRHFRRLIHSAQVKRVGDYVRFEIEGSAFLRGMIRMIAGSLIEVGRSIRDTDDLRQRLADPNSSKVTWVTPACGLCLMKVNYKLESFRFRASKNSSKLVSEEK